jgi:integrase
MSKPIPKYRKKTERGTAYALVSLNGKDHRLGRYNSATSLAKYDQLINLWLANGRKPIRPESLSIAILCSEYLKHSKIYYRKNGKTTDEFGCIKAAIKRVMASFPNEKCSDFGPLKLESVRNVMIGQQCSRSYINKQIGRIKRMFKWGVSRQLIQTETYTALMTLDGLKANRSKAKESPKIEPVSQDVIDATIEHIKHRPAADLVRLQNLIGCRPGELFSLCPRDIETDKGTEAIPIWIYTVDSHKTQHFGRLRKIAMGPKAQAVLRRYMGGAPDGPCFRRKDGVPFKRWTYREYIHEACRKAFPPPAELIESNDKKAIAAWHKIHRWSPNQIRHSVATRIRSEFGLEAAQVILGHSRADVTQIYAERDLKKAIEIIKEIG